MLGYQPATITKQTRTPRGEDLINLLPRGPRSPYTQTVRGRVRGGRTTACSGRGADRQAIRTAPVETLRTKALLRGSGQSRLREEDLVAERRQKAVAAAEVTHQEGGPARPQRQVARNNGQPSPPHRLTFTKICMTAKK